MKIQNQGFDHVEYILNDITPMREKFVRMGFEKIGERVQSEKGLKSEMFAQGYVRILMSQPVGSKAETQDSYRFLKSQAEGVCVLAMDVDDATQAFQDAIAKGARPAMQPTTYESPQGRVVRSEVWTPGQVRYAFMERRGSGRKQDPALFDDGLVVSRMESPSPQGVRVIDHLTNNVGIGEMAKWVDWYKKVFGFVVTRHFKISTGRTGLISDVVESTCGKIKVPINEATEPESQVQEFVDRMKGPGVQHLALLTTDITQSLQAMRAEGFQFLSVPHTYYERVPTRVPGVTEDLGLMEKLGVLLDGDNTGYLLQIFTAEILGPFFFELIQRKGNRGFGEGNFNALFEAIERDQVQRGVLK